MDRLKYYSVSLTLSIGILVAISVTHSLQTMMITVLLALLEISFSFDNAVVNATVLERMSPFWQAIFMYFGIFVAVGVVRFVLPIVIVMSTAGLGFGSVLGLAINDPETYATQLEAAHVQVAVIGGVFLLMIFLSFVFDSDREELWIAPFERPLARFGKFTWLSALITSVVIIAIASSENWRSSVLVSGFASLAIFLVMDWVGNRLENEDEEESDGVVDNIVSGGKKAVGLAGLQLFMYLEFQDAAFSLDGVSGAFAISKDVVVIAAGLGIGALFVRSMTVDLVKSGTLAELRYLEHGAHWAIGVLAACILVSTHVEIPNIITGLIGVVFIAIAVIMSITANKRDAQTADNNIVSFSDRKSA